MTLHNCPFPTQKGGLGDTQAALCSINILEGLGANVPHYTSMITGRIMGLRLVFL